MNITEQYDYFEPAARVSIGDVVALSLIVNAAVGGRHVRWLDDNGNICEGTARAITRHGGGFLRGDEDVRGGYLHVSGMFEQWLRVDDLMAKSRVGAFAVDEA